MHDVRMTVGIRGLEWGRLVRQRVDSTQCEIIRANIHDGTNVKGCRRKQRSTRYGTGRLSVDDFLSLS